MNKVAERLAKRLCPQAVVDEHFEPPKQSCTTEKVRKSQGNEDKKNISSLRSKKIKSKKPSEDTPESKHAQEFFQNYMIPVLTKFHEEKMAVPKKE